VDVYNDSDERVAGIETPAELHWIAPFGAEKAVLEVNLRPSDAGTDVRNGYRVDLLAAGELRFRGHVVRLRTETEGTLLGFDAEREPRLDLTEAISGTYDNQSVTTILSDVISHLLSSPLGYVNEYPSAVVVDHLAFVETQLFYAVDLLAKLAGNRLWDVGWTNVLRFRPPDLDPDHVVYYDRRLHVFRIWESDEPVRNYLRLSGGVVNNNEFRREFFDADSVDRFGIRADSLFARPITTEGAYQLLRAAVLEVLPRPATEKYLDFSSGNLEIRCGDMIELRETGLPGLDQDNVFRIKQEEHRIDAVGNLETRLHLARGLESASRYQFYIDHDPVEDPSLYVERRVGAFKLDLSALDSSAHLDA
jgi:hypothetical protein